MHDEIRSIITIRLMNEDENVSQAFHPGQNKKE
jgi:hypothetical protein